MEFTGPGLILFIILDLDTLQQKKYFWQMRQVKTDEPFKDINIFFGYGPLFPS